MTYLKVFTDFRELMEPLNAEEKGRLFEAMLSYAMDGAEIALEGNERFLWPVARRTIDQEAAAYESKVQANREKGRKGAQARWSRETDSHGQNGHTDSLAKDSPHDQEQEQEQYQDQEKEKEQDQEHAQEYVYDQSAAADTHIPEREEIETYCRERKNGIDPDYFYNYYAATGWQVGQHPVRDWKALIRAWEKRDEQRSDGPVAASGIVRQVVSMAQAARRDRQRNTLLNYRAEPPAGEVQVIDLDPDEL